MSNRMTLSACLILILFISVFGWASWRSVVPREAVGVPEVVDSMRLNDSTEITLTQTFTGTTEPYRVTLWYSDLAGVWHGFYVDHEGLRWRGVFEQEKDDIIVFRSGNRILLEFNTIEKVLSGPGSRKSASPIYETLSSPF